MPKATSTNPPNELSLITSLSSLQSQLQLLGWLGLVPATVNATSYYLVWSRIREESFQRLLDQLLDLTVKRISDLDLEVIGKREQLCMLQVNTAT